MKLTDIWKTKGKPTVSFELFPARNDKAAEKLEKVIDKLASLKPDFVSVTFGAGGSTRQGSYELVKKLKKDKRLEVLPYFAGFGLGQDDILSVVGAYRDLGCESLLAVRGDPPEEESFKSHPQSYIHASELIRFLKQRFELCLGAAGYPEGHKEAESKESDVDYLKQKVANGASFVITQYFYDNSYFVGFMDRCRKAGITVPVVPGVMPIFSLKMMESLSALCGATITPEVRGGIRALPEEDEDALDRFGIDLATQQCRELLKAGAPGIHIYTLDRAKSAEAIVTNLRNDGLL